MEDALRLFGQNSLTLQAARADAQVWAGLARQAGAYPNPSASVSHEPISFDGQSYSESYFNLNQQIEWPGLRRARIDAARRLQDAAYARLAADSSQLAFEVVRAYIGAAAEQQRLDVLQEVTLVIRRAAASLDQQLQEGEVSGYEVRRMRIELSRYENALALSDLTVRDARRRLALLVLPDGEMSQLLPIDRFEGTPRLLQLTELLEMSATQRSEIASAVSEVDAARSALSLSRAERMPKPTLLAGYKRQSDGFRGALFGLSVGLPVFDRGSGKIASSNARLTAAETRRHLITRQIENDVRQTHAAYASLSSRIDLIRNGLLAETADLLQIGLTSYSEGELSLLELIDAAAAYRDAQLSGIDLQTALWTNYFDALRAAGSRFFNN